MGSGVLGRLFEIFSQEWMEGPSSQFLWFWLGSKVASPLLFAQIHFYATIWKPHHLLHCSWGWRCWLPMQKTHCSGNLLVTSSADPANNPESQDIQWVGVSLDYFHHFSEDPIRFAGQWSTSYSSVLMIYPTICRMYHLQWWGLFPLNLPLCL